MVTSQCVLCTGTRFSDYGAGLVKCTRCGLVVAAEIPSDADLAKLYQEDYFFGQEYFDYEADRPALEANFQRRIDRLGPLFQLTSRVVEVGCAYGYFLNLIKDRVAWHQGYDVSEDGIRFARETLGVNAKAKDGKGTVLTTAERLAQRTGLARLNVPVNTFDIMEVLATKA